MTRLTLCAVAVALAANQCLAAEDPVFTNATIPNVKFNVADDGLKNTATNTDGEQTQVKGDAPITNEEMLARLLKHMEQQVKIQINLMNSLIDGVQKYVGGFISNNDDADKVNEVLNTINAKINNTNDDYGKLMAEKDNMNKEHLNDTIFNIITEIYSNDILIDTLWSSLRGVQINDWNTSTHENKKSQDKNNTAAEFLKHMCYNMKKVGLNHQSISKYMKQSCNENVQSPGDEMRDIVGRMFCRRHCPRCRYTGHGNDDIPLPPPTPMAYNMNYPEYNNADIYTTMGFPNNEMMNMVGPMGVDMESTGIGAAVHYGFPMGWGVPLFTWGFISKPSNVMKRMNTNEDDDMNISPNEAYLPPAVERNLNELFLY